MGNASSSAGGEMPVWSPDGRRLFYVRGQQVLAATLTTSPALTVTSRQAVLEGDYTLNPAHPTYDVAPDIEVARLGGTHCPLWGCAFRLLPAIL